MVLLESKHMSMGDAAHNFNLPGIDGNNYSLDNFKDAKALVIIFMCNHCPYVQGVIGELINIQKDYKHKGVQFVGINANESENYPEDSFEKMSEYAEKWGLNFTYLRDDSQEVAKKYQAQCTPDIYVYDQDRKLAYHGRVNDNWQEPEKITRHDLRDALDTILKGKAVEDQHPSMGCSIKWQ